ncbi:MAG: tetratricopeptide repeat protein [Burkholderiaceae bacterium]
MLRIRLLGKPRAEGFGQGAFALAPQRRHQLLVRLAASPMPLTREHLSALLWPQSRAHEASRNLRKLLFDLKPHGLLLEVPLVTSGHTLHWPVDTDLRDFDRALAQGRLGDALDLLDGTPLDGMEGGTGEFDAWLRAERQFWWHRWRDALRRAAVEPTHRPRLGAWLARGLAVDPLDEWLARENVQRVLSEDGQVAARRVYSGWVKSLQQELGVAPTFDFPADTATRGGGPVTAGGGALRPAPAGMQTRFVGRAGDLRALHGLLPGDQARREGARLVNVVGPPGVGKTRLALQWAMQARDLGQDVCVAWLEGLEPHLGDGPGDSAGLLLCIAQALGVALHGNATPESLARALAGRRAVLVLDNFEHRLGDVALLGRLLAETELRLLLTSRVRLGLADEHVYPLVGLTLQGADPGLPVGEAGQLFLDRAAITGPLSAELQRALRATCAMLAGQPLAIEIAARLARHEGVEQVRERLAQDLASLETEAPDLPPRHRSLSAAFEGSLASLPSGLRAALARLTVLQDSFGAAMAVDVAEVSPAMISALADRSLINVEATSGRLRWHAFARELAARHLDHDESATRGRLVRHVAYSLRRLGFDEFGTGSGAQALAWLGTEWPHVQAAWRAALADGRHDTWRLLAEAIGFHYEVQAQYTEGARLLAEVERAAIGGDDAALARAGVRTVRARLEHWLDCDAALCSVALALQDIERLGDLPALVAAWRVRGLVEWRQGRAETALATQQRALAESRRLGQPGMPAILLDGLGLTLVALGRYDEAERHFAEALALNESASGGNTYQAVHNLINLSLRRLREPTAALALARRALELSRELAYAHYEPHALTTMALALMAQQRLEPAIECARRAAAMTRRSGDGYVESWAQAVLGDALTRARQWHEARLAIRRGLSLSWAMDDRTLVMTQLAAAARLAGARGDTTWSSRAWVVVDASPETRRVAGRSAARVQHRHRRAPGHVRPGSAGLAVTPHGRRPVGDGKHPA